MDILIKAFAIIGVIYVYLLAKGAWQILRERWRTD